MNNLDYIDQIIEEEIQNVLLEDEDAPDYEKINALYFKFNPGLKEKWTKAYSNPVRAKRMRLHDNAAIAFNMKNRDAIEAGGTKARMTTAQEIGNKEIAHWYRNTSSKDRAMKTQSGSPSARARFYKKMEKHSAAAGEKVDIAGMDDDDVFTQEPAGWRWTDPLGISGQRQFKFQKDIPGAPGHKISAEELADRSSDFGSSWEGHAGDIWGTGLGVGPKVAGFGEDVVTSVWPTSLAELPFYLIPGGGVAKKAFTATKATLRQAEKRTAKELMKKGMPKQAAKEYAKKRVARIAAEEKKRVLASRLKKVGERLKKGTDFAKQAAKKGTVKGFVKKAAPKFFSKKTPTLDKLLKGFKNVKGFKREAMKVSGKGFWGKGGAIAYNAFYSKYGYATTVLAIAAKGCGKNRTCDEEVLSHIKMHARGVLPDDATALDATRLMAAAEKKYKAEMEKYNVLDNKIKSSKSAEQIAKELMKKGMSKQDAKEYAKKQAVKQVHNLLIKELLEAQGWGVKFDKKSAKRYFDASSKQHGHTKMGDFEDFLENLQKSDVNLRDDEINENYNFIIESIMTKFGF